MYSKTILYEQIDRERDYLEKQDVGTEEYNASMKRLMELETRLADLEKFESESERKDKDKEDEQKTRRSDRVIDICKFVVGTVIIPGIGLVWITATEKESTFRGVLKEYTRYFLPGKK